MLRSIVRFTETGLPGTEAGVLHRKVAWRNKMAAFDEPQAIREKAELSENTRQ
jgi:hypothetical protein